jgi:ABC-type branched-subunit amino acid transport system substrate-binding protein
MKQEGIDVLYVGGYHTEAGLMARQMKEQGMSTRFWSRATRWSPTSTGPSPVTPAKAR